MVDKAITDYDIAIKLKPDYAEAYTWRGTAYNRKSEFDKAISDTNKTIELKPNYAEAYYIRGFTYGMRGDLSLAINDFTRVIELNPDNGDAYYYRGDLRLHLREWEKAKADLTTAGNKGVDVITQFHKLHRTIADFEQKIGIQLPPDIAALLAQQ